MLLCKTFTCHKVGLNQKNVWFSNYVYFKNLSFAYKDFNKYNSFKNIFNIFQS